MMFDPYAADLVRRLSYVRDGAVLEIAAGTGIVTQPLAATLPAAVRIVATGNAMAARFPRNPPQFLARVPSTYNDDAVLRSDLATAGFTGVAIETVPSTSRAASHRDPAIGFCQGSPMRNEIEALKPHGLQAATDATADALAARFGSGATEAPMQAKVVTASA